MKLMRRMVNKIVYFLIALITTGTAKEEIDSFASDPSEHSHLPESRRELPNWASTEVTVNVTPQPGRLWIGADAGKIKVANSGE